MIGSIESKECLFGEFCWSCGFVSSGVKFVEELREEEEKDELVWLTIDLVKWLGFMEVDSLEDFGVLGAELSEHIDCRFRDCLEAAMLV